MSEPTKTELEYLLTRCETILSTKWSGFESDIEERIALLWAATELAEWVKAWISEKE